MIEIPSSIPEHRPAQVRPAVPRTCAEERRRYRSLVTSGHRLVWDGNHVAGIEQSMVDDPRDWPVRDDLGHTKLHDSPTHASGAWNKVAFEVLLAEQDANE